MREIHLDKLPGNFESATILFWHVEEGDRVDEGQALLRLGFEGKSFNINAPVEGIMNEILFVEGEEVKMGDLLATLEEIPVGEGDKDDDEDEESF